MPQVERQPKLIPDWHRERMNRPSGPPPKPWTARLAGAARNALVTVCGATFSFIVQSWPENRTTWLASFLGNSLRSSVRQQSLENMQRVLGRDSRTDAQWDELWEQHTRHVGDTIIESLRFGRLGPKKVLPRVDLAGEEHLQRALAGKRGAMLFINHLGNLACVPAALGLRGYDISISGNAMPSPYIERKVSALHTLGGVKRVLIGEQLPFKAARTFQRNGVFAFFIDFTVVDKHNHWLPFGRAELNTNIGPALIALRCRTPILCATCERLPGHKHRLTVHPPLEVPATKDGDAMAAAVAITRQAIKLLSDDVCSRPEQWWPWDFAQVRAAKMTNDQ